MQIGLQIDAAEGEHPVMADDTETPQQRRRRLERERKQRARADSEYVARERKLRTVRERAYRELETAAAQQHREHDAARKKRQRDDGAPQAQQHCERDSAHKQQQRNEGAPQAVQHNLRNAARQQQQRDDGVPQAQQHNLRDAARKQQQRDEGALQAQQHRERDAKRRRLARAHQPHAYKIMLATDLRAPQGRCIHCNALLLQHELVSAAGNKLKSPCCSDGNVSVQLPDMPDAMQQLVHKVAWPHYARQVTHACTFTTTWVAPGPQEGGLGLHDPMPPPCVLYLHGKVLHWVRSLNRAHDAGADDVNHEMRQWWVTPEAVATGTAERALIEQCREVIATNNPVTQQLVRAVELAEHMDQRSVAMRFKYGDGGPERRSTTQLTPTRCHPSCCRWHGHAAATAQCARGRCVTARSTCCNSLSCS